MTSLTSYCSTLEIQTYDGTQGQDKGNKGVYSDWRC
jgi:hypothetical protein